MFVSASQFSTTCVNTVLPGCIKHTCPQRSGQDSSRFEYHRLARCCPVLMIMLRTLRIYQVRRDISKAKVSRSGHRTRNVSFVERVGNSEKRKKKAVSLSSQHMSVQLTAQRIFSPCLFSNSVQFMSSQHKKNAYRLPFLEARVDAGFFQFAIFVFDAVRAGTHCNSYAVYCALFSPCRTLCID